MEQNLEEKILVVVCTSEQPILRQSLPMYKEKALHLPAGAGDSFPYFDRFQNTCQTT
jgi:hypothetical protein